MSEIIKARVILMRLIDAAPTLTTGQIRKQLNRTLRLMYREGRVRSKAPHRARKVDLKLKRKAKRLLTQTDLSLQEIGHRLGVSQGRISEILHGKR